MKHKTIYSFVAVCQNRASKTKEAFFLSGLYPATNGAAAEQEIRVKILDECPEKDGFKLIDLRISPIPRRPVMELLAGRKLIAMPTIEQRFVGGK